MTPKTRIVLVNMPVLQREILARELTQPDIEVVDDPATATDLARVARKARAEFVITGAARLAADAVGDVLDGCPGVKVLALSDSGRQGLLYELRPHRVPLEDLSSGVLIDTIRRARRPARRRLVRTAPPGTGSNGKRR
jgi:hypothetical protein